MSEITKEFITKMRRGQIIFREKAVFNLVSHAEKLEADVAATRTVSNGLLADLAKANALVEELQAERNVLQAKVDDALKEAVSVIYLNDSSDYLSALWTIVRVLGGQEAADLLESDEQEATRRYCRE